LILTPISMPRCFTLERSGGWNTFDGRRDNRVVGLTPVGRATIEALKMNRPIALAIREEEAIRKRHPFDHD
jgi:hypothetical protein